ncbi:MAG TPA: class I SAM-dependent methyltransferase [Steroidobacter sp.]|jgi:SAM-dependent methyltransferase|nr:class I SAM-dependent methyltransferase [Steroidobacter sp.]
MNTRPAVMTPTIRTPSGAYPTPGEPALRLANLLLSVSEALPTFALNHWLRSRTYYQAFDGANRGARQGQSELKRRMMKLPTSLHGKSVLDIGCAEGFFCLEAARLGASRVIGIDSTFSSLLCAKLLARRAGLKVTYRMGVFPQLNLDVVFDYVFCLSVLHHLVSAKDIWRILDDPSYRMDLEQLRLYLRTLRRLTANGGVCVIEMPYEYADEQSRASVDFTRFEQELAGAGFTTAETLGNWPHAVENREKKDRILYAGHVAQA